VEIRYRKGQVYLDRCGSLMVALQDELGEPFEAPTLPTMEYGELSSPGERLAVRYASKNMVVAQQWLQRPTRVELVAPRAWGVVASKLDVERQVVRCGFRLTFQWKTKSTTAATEAIKRTGFFTPSPTWSEWFGTPTQTSFAGMCEDRGAKGNLRAEISVVEQHLSAAARAELRGVGISS